MLFIRVYSCLIMSTEISTAGIVPLFSSQCVVFLSSGQPTPVHSPLQSHFDGQLLFPSECRQCLVCLYGREPVQKRLRARR